MDWTTLNKGKFEGKTLPQLILKDPQYFFWAADRGIFDKCGYRIAEEAELIAYRATHILIPKKDHEEWLVEYIYSHPDWDFSSFRFVEADRPEHIGSSCMERSKYLDLSRGFTRAYDKKGGRLMISCFKYYILGYRDLRLTKKVCEDFFSNEANFA